MFANIGKPINYSRFTWRLVEKYLYVAKLEKLMS